MGPAAWPSVASANDGEAYLEAVQISYVPEASVRNGSFQTDGCDVVWPREPFTDADLVSLKSSGATIQSRTPPGLLWAYSGRRNSGIDPRNRFHQ